VGGQSRYDRDRPVGDRESAEAQDYRTVAELLDDYRDEIIGDRTVAIKIGNVLRSAATELRAGRALPIQVRRSTRGLAKALRAGSRTGSEAGLVCRALLARLGSSPELINPFCTAASCSDSPRC
jgi:hypothetical protein